eukprot:scaffold5.g850.t1
MHVNQAVILLAHNQADAVPDKRPAARQVVHFAPTLPPGPPPAAAAGDAAAATPLGGGWAAQAGSRDAPGGGAAAGARPPRHVFVLEWGSNGDQPPGEAVTRLVGQLQEQLPEGSMVTILGPAAPEVSSEADGPAAEGGGKAAGETAGGGGAAVRHRHHEHISEEAAEDEQLSAWGRASAASAKTRRDDSGTAGGGRVRQRARGKVVHLQHVPGPCGTVEALVEAGAPDGDAVVVLRSGALAAGAPGSGGEGEEAAADADSHALAALVLLEAALARAPPRPRGRPPLHVVASVRRASTIQAANHLLSALGGGRMTAELLQPDEISADARLRHVLEALLGRPADGTAPGAGRAPPIALAPPQRYGVGPTLAARMSVGHMAEHVRGAGHTLLGYIARSGSFCLVPAAAEERTWGAGDLLIVLRS